MTDQPFGAEVVKVAVPQVGSPVAVVPEVVDRDHAKCPDGCQRAHFGAAQVVLLVADATRARGRGRAAGRGPA